MKALFPLLILGFSLSARAEVISICDYMEELCPHRGFRSSTAPTQPTTGARLNLNPSAVPTEDGFGVEALTYKGGWDFSIVKGTGRIGSALSASTNEETFFGLPAFEDQQEYLRRKTRGETFVSKKYVGALSFNLLANKKQGLKRAELNAGVIARYNQITKNTWGGAGLSGVLGPLTFGYSVTPDESAIDYEKLGLPTQDQFRYRTDTMSAGLYLTNVVFDYSQMRTVRESDQFEIKTTVSTLGLIYKSVILTLSQRSEDSLRPTYSSALQDLVDENPKTARFVGLQFLAGKHAMIGVFSNYYLADEISLGLTVFL